MHTVENPGEGVAQVFTKIPGGVNTFQTKFPGGPLLWVLLQVFLKICLGGLCYTPRPHSPPSVCIYEKKEVGWRWHSHQSYFLSV
jgi:hypothetical protein